MAYKVLIVDDDQELSELLKCYLEGAGFQVKTASGGEEALECYGEFDPHVILLDLVMPVMDGFEVCRILRQERGSKATIVVLSANEIVEDMGRAFNLGVDDYIIKSFEVDGRTIVEKISRHLP